MSSAKITLIGIETYLNPDHSVFEQMQLPVGIDRQILIDTILMRCQEFELLYSDPDFLINAVNVWSRKNYRVFDKWEKALNIEYDPLYNYDRTEEYTDTHDGTLTSNGGNTQTNNLTNSTDITRTDNLSTTNDETVTHSEKAFNDLSYVGTTQDVVDQDGSQTGTVRNAGTVTDTGTVTNVNNNTDKSEYTNTHKARLFGNIGVTTSQQMLQSELDIARWNLYEHIADLFCQEFCIMVY